MSLLSQTDKQRIEQAIESVEEKSAAEIVVAVVARSADYSRGRAVGAGLWAVAMAGVWFELMPGEHAIWVVLLQVPLAWLAWTVLGVPTLHRRLIPRADAMRKVEQAALRLFTERRVYETRDRTGVLILVSELEHQVVILGDRGIHERLGTTGWRRHVEHLVGRIREGRAADGVVEVIEALEPELGSAIPVRPDDENELPNRVIVER